MARLNGSPVRQFRGTTAQHANYTGPSGELTVDTSKNAVVVQDGATKGGHPAAVDATVVHNTGDETVAGLKTFTNHMLMEMRGPWLYAKDTIFERGTVPAAGTGGSYGIGFYDKHADHTNAASLINHRFGQIECSVNENGSVAVRLIANKNIVDDEYATLALSYPATGTPYATAPTPADDVTANEIVTAEWVKKNISVGKVYVAGDGLSLADDTFAVDNTVVRTTGDQTLGGNKTFSQVVKGKTPDAGASSTELVTAEWIRTNLASLIQNILSADEGNALTVEDGKLKVIVVSKDAGNLLVHGSDKGAYTPYDYGALD